MAIPQKIDKNSLGSPWIALIPFILALAFYIFWLDGPKRLYWDETIHVNGARAILYSTPSARDYPPLGREILALSLTIFGDSPAGARGLSAFAGAGSIALVFLIARRLTGNVAAGWIAGLALLLDTMFYLHARLGMLDMFVTFFMILAFWYFLKIREKEPERRSWLSYYVLGFILAFGFSIKAVICVLYPIFLIDLAWALFRSKTPSRKAHLFHLALAFSLPTIFVLWLSYAILGYSLIEIKEHLTWYYNFMSTFQGNPHIISKWYQWIVVKEPIWYLKVNAGPGQMTAVVATGNHVLWFSAEIIFVVLLFCWRKIPKEWYFLHLIIAAQFFFWGIKPTTHIYYMVPLVPFYALLVGVFYAFMMQRFPAKQKYIKLDTAVFLVCCLLVFAYYFPLLSGRPIPKEKVQRYMFPGSQGPASDPKTSQEP